MKKLIWYFTIRKRIGSELIKSEKRISGLKGELHRCDKKDRRATNLYSSLIEDQKGISDILRKLL